MCIIGHYLQALIVFNLLFKEHRNSYSYYMHLIYTMRRYKRIVCFSFTQLMKDFYIQLLDNICLLTMQRFVKTKNTIIHQHNNSIKKQKLRLKSILSRTPGMISLSCNQSLQLCSISSIGSAMIHFRCRVFYATNISQRKTSRMFPGEK